MPKGRNLKDAVEQCGEALTAREATMLSRLVGEDPYSVDGGQALEFSFAQPQRLSAQVEATGAAG